MKQRRAVFLDRDGTINEEVGYLNAMDKLVIIPGAFEAVKLINRLSLKAIVVTNQSGVARGMFDETFLKHVHRYMKDLFLKHGAVIDDFFYCPHHPTEGQGKYLLRCLCRKPEPGMLLAAAKKWNLDLKSSYMIGDQAKDIELIRRVGGKGILVNTGYGSQVDGELIKPDFRARDILEAVKWIERDLTHEYLPD
ncbi:MAG: HAD family hydrolase [Syntrophales bacterium]|nr:HAD family hydrolase [Syntrophales bacterium]